MNYFLIIEFCSGYVLCFELLWISPFLYDGWICPFISICEFSLCTDIFKSSLRCETLKNYALWKKSIFTAFSHSVFLSFCNTVWNFYLGNNFLKVSARVVITYKKVSARALIFHMAIPLDTCKIFLLVHEIWHFF